MNPARLVSIEIEGFRGFAERRLVDLDADAVIVRGDNGTGKTSLIDAVLWVMSGDLEHLVQRVRGLRKGEDAIKSRFNQGGAVVRLRLRLNGRDVVVHRQGTQRATELRVTIDGIDEAEPETALTTALGLASFADVGRAVSSWGILRQDHIRAALDVAGGELHQRLSGIVGLEQVADFATACNQAVNDLRREHAALARSQEQLAGRVQTARTLHAGAREVGGSRERVSETVRDRFGQLNRELANKVQLHPAELSLDAVAEIGRAAGTVLGCLDAVAEQDRGLASMQSGSDEALHAAQQAVAVARSSAEEAIREAPSEARLAEAAIPLLRDHCPVCGQHIDAASVRGHLEEVLSMARRAIEVSRTAQTHLAEAESRLTAIAETARRRKELDRKLSQAKSALTAAIAESAGSIWLNEELAADDLAQHLRNAIGQLRDIYRDAQVASGAHIERLASQAAALDREAQDGDVALRDLERRIRAAVRLREAAHQASKQIVERALAALQPSFAEVFDRLKPSMAFTQLDVRQDVMNNKNQVVPVVRDVERGLEANPALVFSEAQLNVVALSYFLGMALNARDSALPFLILDDPLQALDVIAILNFSDLCRRVRDHRQLILTTHDRRFADVLVRKLSPRGDDETLIVHDFDGWTREGPQINTHRPELATVVPLLREAS